MKRLLVVALLVAAALFVGVGDANATCVAQGKIVYVNTTATGTYIYVATGSTTISFVNYFFTSNVLLANSALNAFASGSRVNATGNAASCATTGTTRLGGTLLQLSIYRNY
jgi:hypothetical protein